MQADPDCILLRQKFHGLTDEEVSSLANFAGLTGGVLMTSDKLDVLPDERGDLFERLLKLQIAGCSFPALGSQASVIDQLVHLKGNKTWRNLFNTGDSEVTVPGVVELAARSSKRVCP